jgi:hypothetical protein
LRVPQRFEFYHAAVFLIDAHREYAVVRGKSGEGRAGDEAHGSPAWCRFQVDRRFGHRTRRSTGCERCRAEPTYFANPLLPETQAEAALPLRVGTRSWARSTQSRQQHAFTADNLRSLQILADQLAVAVANTELSQRPSAAFPDSACCQITTAAASGTSLMNRLRARSSGIRSTLGEDRAAILLADPGKSELKMQAAAGYPAEFDSYSVPVGAGISAGRRRSAILSGRRDGK